MQKLTLICAILLTSGIAYADDTTTETCADGAGTVIKGVISGHKYCLSNNNMNWWNAHTWCDGIKMKLFSLEDCQCTALTNCTGLCVELATGVSTPSWVVVATPKSSTLVHNIRLADGLLGAGISKGTTTIPAICK